MASEEEKARVIRKDWVASKEDTKLIPIIKGLPKEGLYCPIIEGVVVHSKYLCNCKSLPYLFYFLDSMDLLSKLYSRSQI